MDAVTSMAFAKTILELYGPLGLGWVAWGFTLVILVRERKRYHNLVTEVITYSTKLSMIEGGTRVTQIAPKGESSCNPIESDGTKAG